MVGPGAQAGRPVDPVAAFLAVLELGAVESHQLMTLTDEELYALTGEYPQFGGFPHLDSLPPDQRVLARDTAYRSMLARDVIRPAGSSWCPVVDVCTRPDIVGTLQVRRLAPQAVSARRTTVGEAETLVAHILDYAQAALLETIDARGAHTFTVMPLAHAFDALGGFCDPDRVAEPDLVKSAEHRRAVNTAEVLRGVESLGDIEHDARAVTVLHGFSKHEWMHPADSIEALTGSPSAVLDSDGAPLLERRSTVYAAADRVEVATPRWKGPILDLVRVDRSQLLEHIQAYLTPRLGLSEELIAKHYAAATARLHGPAPRPAGRR
ncbi:hypothetical protein GCM10022261_21900 [Brevibacterium daeguense]|uniref:Uncharacterized protein n=1 Tax=Brevibacterium daeguense TaxID=909936 RepID=A0ABP8EL16_9MICO